MNQGDTKANNILIGKNKIVIKDKFTLIQGKFSEEQLLQYKQMGKYGVINEFKFVPLKTFVDVFKGKNSDLAVLDKFLDLKDLIEHYNSRISNNEEIVVEYSRLLSDGSATVDFIKLLAKKELLLNELELAKTKAKSSDKSAKMDLLNKLSNSIKKTQNQLDYLGEDYLKVKNKRNQIKNTIEESNSQINELNKEKKGCFSKINAITRGLEENGPTQKIEGTQPQSASEQIKSLQNQAKEAQFKINKIKSNLKELDLKYQSIEEKFVLLDNDYQKLVNMVKNDSLRIDELKNDLKNGIDDSNHLININLSKMNVVRNLPEIEAELDSVENNLERLFRDKEFLKKGGIEENIGNILKNIAVFQEEFRKKKKKAIIMGDNENVVESIESLRTAESLVKELQIYINNFLGEINLSCDFLLMIKEEETTYFWINLQFTRSNKERIDFEGLTTPEKIFFIVSFYISIQIQLAYSTIVFSNLFVKSDYNKQGSIFRTIRKMIPIITNDEKLKKRKYIFILSELKMKKPIDNLKIITINEKGE